MEATLTWLDLTASDRDEMRRVLDLFKERGTLDEMGLGSLRDALWQLLVGQGACLRSRQRLFVERWGQRIAELETGAVAGDRSLRSLIYHRYDDPDPSA